MRAVIEMVFVTIEIDELDTVQQSIDESILMDWGTTDREGDGFICLRNGEEARHVLDDLLEDGILIDYTIFSIEVSF